MKIEDIIDNVNIAEDLDSTTLNDISSKVMRGYERDLESRSTWIENNDRWMKLASQVMEKKNYPWENASNVKYPLLTTAAIQFHARAYPALVPNTNVVKAKVIGFDSSGEKQDSAIRVSRYMDYQVLHQMKHWDEEMDRLLMTLPIIGCVFKKTYYSPSDNRNVSEMILPKHLVVNYWTKNLEDSYRITHILEASRNTVVQRIREGLYKDCDLGDAKVSKHNHRSTSDETAGTTPTDDESVPYTLLEQHTYLDLDEDGYEEPYIITCEENSGEVLRIVANYTEEDVTYNDSGDVSSIKGFEHFTKFSFIPNPDGGFYDVGFGILLGPINEAANTMINLLTDSGTLSNLQSGYLGRGIKLKKGQERFTPGEWKQINVSGDDLRKSILPLPVREPSNVLFQLLGTLLDSGQRLASTTDMMVGENPGQNQKASTTMAVLEQGMKVFTAIYKRIHRSLGKEFNKLFELNVENPDPEAYQNILDLPDDIDIYAVYKHDHNKARLDILPSADPSIVSEAQRLAKAQALVELIPLGVNQQEALVRMLEAQEQPNVEKLLEPVPQGPDPELELKNKELDIKSSVENRKLDIKEAELGLNLRDKAEKNRQTERKLGTDELKVINDMMKSEQNYVRSSNR
jgi:chaperonin GroES